MPLLFLVMLSCACAGSHGFWTDRKACYGSDFSIPLADMIGFKYQKIELLFMPYTPGQSELTIQESEGIPVVLKNGTVLDPHYEISSDKFIIRDVTERDKGLFAFTWLRDYKSSIFKLLVEDCSSKVTRGFGSDYRLTCPKNAYSLEFTPLENTPWSEPQVLWNHTTPVSESQVRGQMVNNKWTMNQITYEYAGYYTFRDQNYKFISRYRMAVEEDQPYSYSMDDGEDLHIKSGMDPVLFVVTFQKDGHYSPMVLMQRGKLRQDTVYDLFEDRFRKLEEPTLHIEIENLQPGDSGTFEFRDWKGNLAFKVFLKVERQEVPEYVSYLISFAIVSAFVLCCCFVTNRCCKSTPGKTTCSDTDSENPPALPSASRGAAYPLHHNEPGSSSRTPLVPVPVEPHRSSSRPEARNTRSQDNYSDKPPPYDSLFPADAEPQQPEAEPHCDAQPNTDAELHPDAEPHCNAEPQQHDAEPQFELNGAASSSDPPLSSDTSCSDVYTSDKLNFL